MPQILTELKVDEVSLVDRPANSEVDPVTGLKIPRARIALFKRDDQWDDADPICKAVDGKTEGGKTFPRSDYAYTPSDNVSEWKLRLTSTPGGAPDPHIVGAAIAALGKGFRGKKVQIPSDALAGVKSKVRAAWRKANPDKGEDELPPVLKGESMTLQEIEQKVTEQDGKIAKLETDNAVLKSEKAVLEEVVKMGKKERKAFGAMSDAKQKEYMAADAEKRAKMMAECKGADEPDADDEDMKKIAKAHADEIEVLKKEATTAKEQFAAIAKRERLLHFSIVAKREIPNTTGTDEQKGERLMKLADSLGGEESADYKGMLATLKAADKKLGESFTEIGKWGGDRQSAAAELNGKIQEIAKRDNISIAKATDKAMTENPELYLEYRKQIANAQA